MRWAKAVEDEKQKQNRKGKTNGESDFPVWRLLFRCMGNEFILSSLCYPFWLSCMILQVSSLESFSQSDKIGEFLRIHQGFYHKILDMPQ